MDKKLFIRRFRLSDWKFVMLYIIAVYTLSLFVPYISPFTRYPLYIARCGGLPIVASNFAAGYDYQLPSDSNYQVNPFTNAYFCTERDAKAANYHHFAQ